MTSRKFRPFITYFLCISGQSILTLKMHLESFCLQKALYKMKHFLLETLTPLLTILKVEKISHIKTSNSTPVKMKTNFFRRTLTFLTKFATFPPF